MPAAFAELEELMTQAVYAHLANVTVTPSVGQPFDALLDVADAMEFDAIAHATHTLRAPSASVAGWSVGTQVPIGSAVYRVAAPPMRINAHESRIALVLAAPEPPPEEDEGGDE